MSVITILLGLGICVFLTWFFEAIMKDHLSDEDCRVEYYEE
jgi:hypothetical protein